MKDGLFNHPGPRAAGPDVSTWKTIRSERVRTHHHSDVLGQIPGAPLEEIREGGLRRNTAVYTHTHRRTHAETEESNRITLHYAALIKKRSPACNAPILTPISQPVVIPDFSQSQVPQSWRYSALKPPNTNELDELFTSVKSKCLREQAGC